MSTKQSKATKQGNSKRAAERAAAIRREQEARERRRRTLIVTVIVLISLTLLLGIGYAVQSSRDTTGRAATTPTGVVQKYGVPFGDVDAPVRISIYEDFLCPFCGQFEARSREALEVYVDQGDVLVEYHVLSYLDRASNGTDYSTRSMNALGVVLDNAGPDVAKNFHDLLFENQPEEGSDGLSDTELVGFAVKAGASESDVAGPIESLKFEPWVENATDAASKEGVASTPTVLVDGEQVDFETIDELMAGIQQAVDSALSEQ